MTFLRKISDWPSPSLSLSLSTFSSFFPPRFLPSLSLSLSIPQILPRETERRNSISCTIRPRRRTIDQRLVRNYLRSPRSPPARYIDRDHPLLRKQERDRASWHCALERIDFLNRIAKVVYTCAGRRPRVPSAL